MGELFAEFDVWGAFWLTIKLSVWSAVWALLLGTVLAIMRVGPVRILNVVGAAYVNIVRNTPLTLVVLFSLTVLGTRLGIQIANDESPTFLVDEAVRWAIFALSVYHAAFVCEAIRSGINTVPPGQAEAARSIGLGFTQNLRHVVLPQAIRHVIPPLVNTFIAFFKDTSLVLIIGIFDLLTTAKTAIVDPAWQSFSVEVYVFVGVIYFVFCFAMSRYSRSLEAQRGTN